MRMSNSENIYKLRKLVDELEGGNSNTPLYKETLHEIESLVKNEIKLISELKTINNKIKHYENVCAGILGMISTTKF